MVTLGICTHARSAGSERSRSAYGIARAVFVAVVVLAAALGVTLMLANPAPVGADPGPLSFNILLGRPTDESITANIIPDHDGESYIEYGTTLGGPYTSQTDTFACVTDDPVEVVIDGLTADTKYYYRLQFEASGSSEWAAGDEYSFRTQRAPGDTYTFTIISDSHLGQYGGGTADQQALYEQTLLNAQDADPDGIADTRSCVREHLLHGHHDAQAPGHVHGSCHDPFDLPAPDIPAKA